jgi:hypothetical protein
MILSFKPQFVTPILMGTKIHTIREDGYNRWSAGRKIHFATGLRTKNYEEFHTGVCVSVEPITLYWSAISGLTARSGKILIDLEQLAYNDGFNTVEDFERWFIPQIHKKHGGKMNAKIIHWTWYRYVIGERL